MPPSGPHFGDLWEASIRSMKYHLRRKLGNKTVTSDELFALLSQTEACLHPQPLTVHSSNTHDLS
jgi:hypothetical protein